MQRVTRVAVAAMLAVGLLSSSWVGQAQAGLNFFTSFNDAALSIDGLGQTGTGGQIQTSVPSGATVLAAYMYVTTVFSFSGGTFTDVTLRQGGNSVLLPAAGGTLLDHANPSFVRRHDVTTFVNNNIASGLQNWVVDEANSSLSNGTVLVVAYRHSTTTGATAIIMDGELALNGDSTTLGFAPYMSGAVIMSLASEHSAGGGQFTTVDVTTSSNSTPRRLSGCAGGFEDGQLANGALITVGGIGDTTANPGTAPCADDELYDLSEGNPDNPDAFIAAGDTSLTFLTRNPSNDDNVFFIGINAGFRVTDVDDISTDAPTDDTPSDDGPPPSGVPAPAPLMLLGLGLLAAGISRRFRR